MAVTLVVVDETPLVVAGLLAVLEPFAQRVRVVGTCPTAPSTRAVDLLLRDDLASPPAGTATPRVVRHAKRVVFSWTDDPVRIRQALDDGADGYLSKALAPADLVDAVERIHRGERVARCPSGDLDLGSGPGRWPGQDHGLSARESEVLALICQGLSNAEISDRVYLSLNTVKTYIRSAYRKMDVATRPQAVIWGLQHGFADRPGPVPAEHV